MNGGAEFGFCVFHRGCDGCLAVLCELTVTGDENKLKLVGLMTPDMPPTLPMLG